MTEIDVFRHILDNTSSTRITPYAQELFLITLLGEIHFQANFLGEFCQLI